MDVRRDLQFVIDLYPSEKSIGWSQPLISLVAAGAFSFILGPRNGRALSSCLSRHRVWTRHPRRGLRARQCIASWEDYRRLCREQPSRRIYRSDRGIPVHHASRKSHALTTSVHTEERRQLLACASLEPPVRFSLRNYRSSANSE